MAIAPRRGAFQASAEDDFYGQEADIGGDEGQGIQGQDGQAGPGEAEDDAAFDAGAEQEIGDEDPLNEEEDLLNPELPQSRGQTRQQRLANENRRLQERLSQYERQPVTQPQAAQPAGPREETEAEFEARVRELPTEERMEQRYLRREAQQNRQNLLFQVHQANASDKAAFDLKARTDGRYARWQERVEAEHALLLQRGQIVSREEVLAWLIGKHVLSNKGAKGLQRERQNAARRVERQTVRPSGGSSSDVRPVRRGQMTESQARARRLENLQI